ncbi:FabD/lysophospholipase-like protein [Pleomassaria siparia CBS 279.74]|uniref:FabD/lysophospholipase-like protein n=1 Tax=Pleomassaria siparia CBS 279.74 TaxID=1314801 RepID=A0A6G1KQ85_9PLEO|nr:FabD/lysophospholipase-like protein [Pleomassaria siparia CBS 279.74]
MSCIPVDFSCVRYSSIEGTHYFFDPSYPTGVQFLLSGAWESWDVGWVRYKAQDPEIRRIAEEAETQLIRNEASGYRHWPNPPTEQDSRHGAPPAGDSRDIPPSSLIQGTVPPSTVQNYPRDHLQNLYTTAPQAQRPGWLSHAVPYTSPYQQVPPSALNANQASEPHPRISSPTAGNAGRLTAHISHAQLDPPRSHFADPYLDTPSSPTSPLPLPGTRDTKVLLSLDGDGVRGLSTILLVESLVNAICSKMGRRADPYQIFDLIGGASTGGVLAVMLGRLRMRAHRAREAYVQISKAIFLDKWNFFASLDPHTPQRNHEAESLDNILKEIIIHEKVNINDPFFDTRTDSTNVFVISTQVDIGINRPALVRTYPTRRMAGPELDANLTTWQAMRATSVAPRYMDHPRDTQIRSKVIEPGLVDYGTGKNNPIRDLVFECRKLYGYAHDTMVVVSIGTGIGLDRTREISEMAIRVEERAGEAQIAGEKFEKDNENLIKRGWMKYFRFNVPDLDAIPLDEWSHIESIKELTHAYLENPEHNIRKLKQQKSALRRHGKERTSLPYRLWHQLHATTILPVITMHQFGGIHPIVLQGLQTILSIDPKDIDGSHSFITLGGDSLAAIRLATYCTERQLPVIVRDIIQSTRLDQVVENSWKDAPSEHKSRDELSDSPMQAPTASDRSPSKLIPDSLEKYNARSGTSAFNVSHVYDLNAATVDYERLCTSWDRVLARHDILRSRFINNAGGVRIYQSNPPHAEFVKGIDVWKLINHEFDLEKECPIRITVSPRYLVICISHIVCEFTTLCSLLDEFSSFYLGFSPAAPINKYEDTCWGTKVGYPIRDFWRDYLPEPKKTATLAIECKRNMFRGTSYAHKFAPSSQRILHSIIDMYNLTHHQTALAVVSLALESVLSSDVVFGSPFMGRSEENESTIDLFLQPLPICIPKTSADTPLHQFLASLRASSQSALTNAIPWNAILDRLIYSATTSSSSTHTLLDVMVTFHDEREEKGRHVGLKGFEELFTWSEGAKFPLMFEFTLMEGFLMLRVEYSDELFTDEEVVRLVEIAESVLQGLKVCSSVDEVVKRAKEGRVTLGGSEVKLGSKRCGL